MDDNGALFFFPWKYLWKTFNFAYFFHGILGPFSDNLTWNSSVFHRGGTDKKWNGPINGCYRQWKWKKENKGHVDSCYVFSLWAIYFIAGSTHFRSASSRQRSPVFSVFALCQFRFCSSGKQMHDEIPVASDKSVKLEDNEFVTGSVSKPLLLKLHGKFPKFSASNKLV